MKSTFLTIIFSSLILVLSFKIVKPIKPTKNYIYMDKKNDAKLTMLPHSKAKVDFYEMYIKRYLQILSLSPKFSEINIFDVFCGVGTYDNDQKGSPLVAYDAIEKLHLEYGFRKNINLYVNDVDAKKVLAVQNYIDSKNKGYCNVIYTSKPVSERFYEIYTILEKQDSRTRNIIFIDPYGYKDLEKYIFENLLLRKRTEIILWLPIQDMLRFTHTAMNNESKTFQPLREFIESFFDGDHPIKQNDVKPLDYIEYIKEALKFDGKFFSTSYYIQKEKSRYYAVFFISPNHYGFEKILEVKWQLDDLGGNGFKKPIQQPSLFAEVEKQEVFKNYYTKLEDLLKKLLSISITNQQLYDVALKNEFLPKHVVEVLTNWQNSQGYPIEVIECETKKPARKGAFYISYKYYRDTTPKVNIKRKI